MSAIIFHEKEMRSVSEEVELETSKSATAEGVGAIGSERECDATNGEKALSRNRCRNAATPTRRVIGTLSHTHIHNTLFHHHDAIGSQ